MQLRNMEQYMVWWLVITAVIYGVSLPNWYTIATVAYENHNFCPTTPNFVAMVSLGLYPVFLGFINWQAWRYYFKQDYKTAFVLATVPLIAVAYLFSFRMSSQLSCLI